MAWAGTTTYIDSPQLAVEKVVIQTTNTAGSTKMQNEAALPGGVRLTTGTDVVRFPYNSVDGMMVIAAYFNESTSVAGYPVIMLRNPPTTDGRAWRAKTHIGTSTAESGWTLIASTASITLTTAQSALVTFGPFESAKWGHVFPGASSNGIDKDQQYIEAMIRLSTVGSTDTVMNSTTLWSGAINVISFELP